MDLVLAAHLCALTHVAATAVLFLYVFHTTDLSCVQHICFYSNTACRSSVQNITTAPCCLSFCCTTCVTAATHLSFIQHVTAAHSLSVIKHTVLISESPMICSIANHNRWKKICPLSIFYVLYIVYSFSKWTVVTINLCTFHLFFLFNLIIFNTFPASILKKNCQSPLTFWIIFTKLS